MWPIFEHKFRFPARKYGTFYPCQCARTNQLLSSINIMKIMFCFWGDINHEVCHLFILYNIAEGVKLEKIKHVTASK